MCVNWCHKYSYAGYGGIFYKWLNTKVTPQSYNSWGNGSAMRVSPVGWALETLEEPLVLVTIYHKPVMKSVRYISLTKVAKVLFPKR
ncbi:hypothetical protein [Rodentibacter rarus]|uniref:hypothetical protein n=1 Tax=Rodentibacter rarus TaxID=1908260 RepID=UPI001ABF70A7|nr:hypothetical protein [Rodentibacter rarus]